MCFVFVFFLYYKNTQKRRIRKEKEKSIHMQHIWGYLLFIEFLCCCLPLHPPTSLTLMPSKRDRALRGLRARRVLRDLIALSSEYPMALAPKLTNETCNTRTHRHYVINRRAHVAHKRCQCKDLEGNYLKNCAFLFICVDLHRRWGSPANTRRWWNTWRIHRPPTSVASPKWRCRWRSCLHTPV